MIAWLNAFAPDTIAAIPTEAEKQQGGGSPLECLGENETGEDQAGEKHMQRIEYPEGWPDDDKTRCIALRGIVVITHPDRVPHMFCDGEWMEVCPPTLPFCAGERSF